MARDNFIPEHRRYSQRLAHLEEQSASANKSPHRPIGTKVTGIKNSGKIQVGEELPFLHVFLA